MNYPLRPDDTSEASYAELQRLWREHRSEGGEKQKVTVSWTFIRILFRAFRRQLFNILWIALVFSLLEFVNTVIIYYSLKKFKTRNEYPSAGEFYSALAFLVGGLVFTKLFYSVLSCNLKLQENLIGARVSNAIRCLIYQKLVCKSTEREAVFTLGEITNLIQTDGQNLEALAEIGGFLVSMPLELSVGFVGLYLMMGNAIFPALACVGLAGLFNWAVSKRFKDYKQQYRTRLDERGRLVSELFENIRFVKLQGLENQYLRELLAKKEQEIAQLRLLFHRYVYMSGVNDLIPALFLVAINAFHILLTGQLALEKAFTSVMILNLFKRNFKLLPEMLDIYLDVSVSSARISLFMFSEEIDTRFITRNDGQTDTAYSIELVHGNFAWKSADADESFVERKNALFRKKKDKKNKQADNTGSKRKQKGFEWKGKANTQVDVDQSRSLNEPLMTDLSIIGEEEGEYQTTDLGAIQTWDLKNLNIRIKKGDCVAIIGKVGCGKSSLLSALLGEMYFSEGTKLSISSKIAYVSQQPWTVGQTIRENILMGLPYDAVRFQEALKLSCFLEDLEYLPNRELTIVGNRGVNLSGGQKTRLAIARAFYSDSEIYLLDDVLSALDINVGRSLMEDLVLRGLKGKTVVMATHALTYLPYFNYIYVLDSGRVAMEGDYPTLSKDPKFAEINDIINSVKTHHEEAPIRPADIPDNTTQVPSDKVFQDTLSKLVSDAITIEDKAQGMIQFSLIRKYIGMIGWLRLSMLVLCKSI